MAETKKVKKHIVVFQDEEGNVLKTSFVSHEEAALPPEMPQKKGESAHYEIKFQGWDKDISSVKENLVVKAVYKEVPKEYLIMYFHENGKMLGTETVPYGQAATQPYHPQKPQTEEHYYIFKGWNNDLSHIEKDTMAKAVFEERQRSFVVRFFHENGTLLKEEKVLYGQAAQEPEVPVKQQDEVYHYIFNGWDNTFDHIKENTEVHAVFSSVYNEYKVSIYEQRETNIPRIERKSEDKIVAAEERLKSESIEQQIIKTQIPEKLENEYQEEAVKEELVEEKFYHYGDVIKYPILEKKGYTLQWSIHPETVTQNEEIYASWVFSNPVGGIFEVDGNYYQILNPSITNGSVRLLSYTQDASQIQIPKRVQIGDYYYFIEEIAIRAFCNCIKMRTLILPNCVRIISDGAFMDCKRLEKVVLGKGTDIKLHSIGKKAFAGNEHLREIYFAGRNLRKVYPATFEGVRKTVKISVIPSEKAKIEKLLQKALQEGKVLIDLI